MRTDQLAVLLVCLLVGCGDQGSQSGGGAATAPPRPTLPEARRGFQTTLVRQAREGEPVEPPPAELFRLVQYDAPVGKLAAYLGPPPSGGGKRPAIIWCLGGFSNSIGDVWTEQPPSNDQSASAFREAGIVMMYPSLRGGNQNPGFKEGFFGEVDDVLAAAEFLSRQEYVDPQRIYLGGHSTGGTLALLVAECSGRFRAVFAFGPAADVRGYGSENIPADLTDAREVSLRNPGPWLHGIQSPVWVLEGIEDPSNADALQDLAAACTNPVVHLHPVRRANHFSILAPATRLLARKIVQDTGPRCSITLTEQELDGLLPRRPAP